MGFGLLVKLGVLVLVGVLIVVLQQMVFINCAQCIQGVIECFKQWYVRLCEFGWWAVDGWYGVVERERSCRG